MVENARKKVASFIGASPEEIIFVGSGSEANNTVLSIFTCTSPYCSHTHTCNTHIITTKIEHPCILETSKCLEGKNIKLSYLDVDRYGKVNLGQLKEMITETTGMVSIMAVNKPVSVIEACPVMCITLHDTSLLLASEGVIFAII